MHDPATGPRCGLLCPWDMLVSVCPAGRKDAVSGNGPPPDGKWAVQLAGRGELASRQEMLTHQRLEILLG